ncbi:MAG: outer membrane beta-barrel protein [Ferruginibacter sp.]
MEKNKVRSTLLSIGLCLFSYVAFSQVKPDTTIIAGNDTPVTKTHTDSISEKKPKRLTFGCGFGLNFVGGTSISLSPNLNYKLSNKISVGVGIQGSYASVRDLQNTTTFGANVLGQYYPIKKILLTLEFAQLRVSTETKATDSTRNYWDSALFAGAGYNITSKISFGAKYNFLYKKDKSVYSSPVIPFVNITF